MKKTISQIQFEMETVKLIKEVMEVDGKVAYELLKDWTGDEPKVDYEKFPWDTTIELIGDLKNPYNSGNSIAESLFSIIDSYSELNKKSK